MTDFANMVGPSQTLPLAFQGDTLAGALGVALAFLIVGGWVALRWQRNRQQFALLQAALEQGLPPARDGLPAWLVSLREGVLTLTLGLGLVGVGTAGYALAAAVPESTAKDEPAPSYNQPQPRQEEDRDEWLQGQPPPPHRFDPDDDGPRPPRPEPRRDGQRPPRPEAGRQPQQPPQPPRPNPVHERWHRAQDQLAFSLIAIGGGVVLILLGTVRIAFARMERRYLSDAPAD